jgi:hypothetical protein
MFVVASAVYAASDQLLSAAFGQLGGSYSGGVMALGGGATMIDDDEYRYDVDDEPYFASDGAAFTSKIGRLGQTGAGESGLQDMFARPDGFSPVGGYGPRRPMSHVDQPYKSVPGMYSHRALMAGYSQDVQAANDLPAGPKYQENQPGAWPFDH